MKDILEQAKAYLFTFKEEGEKNINDAPKTKAAMKQVFGWLNNVEEDQISNLTFTSTGATFVAHDKKWTIKVSYPMNTIIKHGMFGSDFSSDGWIQISGSDGSSVIIKGDGKKPFLSSKHLKALYDALGVALLDGKFQHRGDKTIIP